MGGLGAGRGVLGVSKPRGQSSIDPGSQGSISWCDLLNSLLVPQQARSRLAFTSVFIYSLSSFPSSSSEAPGGPSGAGITTWAGQGSGGCKEQPLRLLMPSLPLHQGWDVLLLPRPWDWALFLLFLVER